MFSGSWGGWAAKEEWKRGGDEWQEPHVYHDIFNALCKPYMFPFLHLWLISLFMEVKSFGKRCSGQSQQVHTHIRTHPCSLRVDSMQIRWACWWTQRSRGTNILNLRTRQREALGAGFTALGWKIQSQRGRDCDHKATAEFVDVIFTAAYKRHALMHHCNKIFNKVPQKPWATLLSPSELLQCNAVLQHSLCSLYRHAVMYYRFPSLSWVAVWITIMSLHSVHLPWLFVGWEASHYLS